MSLSIWRGAFGRCTLTATRRPFGSTARCTWPIDAAATGCSSNSRKSRPIGWLKSSRDDPLDLGERERLDVVLEAAQLGDDVRRHDVGARREQLAELDERRPELVEHLAEMPAAVRAVVRRPSAAVEQVAEAVLDGDLGDLAQPADARGLRARGHGQVLHALRRAHPASARERRRNTAVHRDHAARRCPRALGDEEGDGLGNIGSGHGPPEQAPGGIESLELFAGRRREPRRARGGAPPTRASSRRRPRPG